MSQSLFQPVAEHTLTDFLQHSGKVLAEVDKGGVLLHRRDGEDLVVMTRGQSDALAAALRAFAAAVRAPRFGGAARTGQGTGGEAAVLPWLPFLSAADQEACLQELSDVASA